LRLKHRGFVFGFIAEVKQQGCLFEVLFLELEGIDVGFNFGLLFEQGLGLFLNFPKAGRAGNGIELGYAAFFARNVKDTPLAPLGAGGGRRCARESG